MDKEQVRGDMKTPDNKTHGKWLSPDISEQVWMWSNQVTLALEKTPLEQLRQSNHPRAESLITWLESNEENKKWYLENVWTNFDLVQDWIKILWNTWELKDATAEENPKKWIWNKMLHIYFSFDAQKELFWNKVPSKDDWVNLANFLPWNDKNKVIFLSSVLWLRFGGEYNYSTWEIFDKNRGGRYWSSSILDNSDSGYLLYFNTARVGPSNAHYRRYGFLVRCFKN